MGQVPEGPPVLGESWRYPILPSPILAHPLSQAPPALAPAKELPPPAAGDMGP